MTSATRHLLGAAALLATGALTACGPVHGNPASGGAGSSPSGGAAAASSAPASPASSPAASHGSTAAAGCSSSALSAHVDLAQGGAGGQHLRADRLHQYLGQRLHHGRLPGRLVRAQPLGRPARQCGCPQPGGAARHGHARSWRHRACRPPGGAGNYSSSACTPVTAHWLKIFPPNQVTAIYAHYEVQACSAKLPAKLGSQLDVYVVRPGAGKAGHAP